MYDLKLDQVQTITFVMINSAGTEISGLGSGFSLEVSKAGGAFASGAGTKSEISNGWYSYEFDIGELDTVGPLSVRVTGTGCVQQNLAYNVISGVVGAIEFTYTITNSVTLLPIEGVEVWFTTDIGGQNVVWKGDTDAFGVARDDNENLPMLDVGTYYVWRQKTGFVFADPDIEVVSP